MVASRAAGLPLALLDLDGSSKTPNDSPHRDENLPMKSPHLPSDWKPSSVERFKFSFRSLPIIRLVLGGLCVPASILLAFMFASTVSASYGPDWPILGIAGVVFLFGAFMLRDAIRDLYTPDYLVEIDPNAGVMLLVQPKGIERKNPREKASNPARWQAYVRDPEHSKVLRSESITRLTVEVSTGTQRKATRGGGSFTEQFRAKALIAWPEQVVVLAGAPGGRFERDVTAIAATLGKEISPAG